MNKKMKYACYKAVEKIFRCPICKTSMILKDDKSLICQKNHCFDLARTGYINFIPHQKRIEYTKELFEHRGFVLESGFYQPLIDCINELILKYSNFPYILDVGCGEGFYARKIAQSIQCEMFALDIVKDAIVLASKSNKFVRWLIADLYNIPLQSNSIDVILNIFTPANYNEFFRVMREEGILIKVIPGNGYLKELRECAKEQLLHEEYSNALVIQYFKEHIKYLERKHLLYKSPVNSHQIYSFAKMTPMMFHVDLEETNLKDISEITIELEVLVGQIHKGH